MNTKLLLGVCAVVLIIAGILLLFLPQEIASSLNVSESSVIFLQLLAALYFAFGAMNWMSKSNMIGGIYNRPLLIGNFSHFFIGALSLIKLVIKSPTETLFIIAMIFYVIFAILFGFLFFKNPKLKKNI